MQRKLKVLQKETPPEWVVFLFGAGYEARTRFPASHELRSAIRRNPAPPLIKMRFAHGCRYRVLFANEKNQGIQIGCPDLLWSGLRGSNSLPPPWQGGALPDELSPRNKKYYSKAPSFCQAFFTFFSIVFSMSFKEPITAPVLLKIPPIPSEHPTAPQPPALLDTPEFLPPWA